MDKGTEGDEILIFACREIGCDIPAKVTTIGQLTTETFIQIIAKSLALISNGDIQVRCFFFLFLSLKSFVALIGSFKLACQHCCSPSYLY